MTIDVRDFITTGPARTDWLEIIDGYRTGNEYIAGVFSSTPPNALRIADYLSRSPTSYLFGPRRNFDASLGYWRVFTNPGTNVEADYPPQGTPLVMTLPTLAASNEEAPTQGATLIPEYQQWRAFTVHAFDPKTCKQGPVLGTIWHRVYAFVLASHDFAPPLGTQRNVLVIQDAMTGNVGTGWQLLETYYYVEGYGRARETAYDKRNHFGVQATNWSINMAGTYKAPVVCPLGNEATW